MKHVDREFYHLTNELQELTGREIFQYIKGGYMRLSPELKKSFEDYFSQFEYWGKLDHKNEEYEEIQEKAQSLHEHIEDYIWLYERLKDYRSKKLLFGMMNNWYNYDFTTLEEMRERTYPDYFDLDIVKCDKEEVVADLGAYTGDTALDYIKMYGEDSLKKMYCYEITGETFVILENNLSKYPNIECRMKAASSETKTLFMNPSKVDSSANTVANTGTYEVKAVTLDDDIKEPLTVIKMDIEGAEQEALKGCCRHIENDHPKLLLSVYHNNKDIWKIPRMIDEICPGYQFYLRSHGGNIFPTEITLLAIYDENIQ